MPQPRPAMHDDPSRRDQIAKLLDPLGLVVITRERVTELLEDAVRRGRMTRDDAQELATALVSRGRQGAEELLVDLEQLLGRPRGETFPIPDYDELTAAQVTGRLGDLTPAQLRRVRDHEKGHANRKSVLQALERRLSR